MKTEVAILHHEYPADVRQRIEEKLQGLVGLHEGLQSIRATLGREHNLHRVELVARVRRAVVLVVDERDENLGRALDEGVHRMARVLKRNKDKLLDVHRRRMRA